MKSQAVPETVTAEGMTTLVGSNHDEFVTDPTKDVLVEYYAPWCGHCKKLAPVWADLAKKTEGIENLIIAQMDATENETDKVTITGFPTIMFYPAVKKPNPLKYKSKRDSAEDFLGWLSTNSNVYKNAMKTINDSTEAKNEDGKPKQEEL